MYHTYIIESKIKEGQRYIGHTSNLKKRIAEHNSAKCLHTAKFRPWKLKLYIGFESLELARQFESYLKSGSGHAFANKHFGF